MLECLPTGKRIATRTRMISLPRTMMMDVYVKSYDNLEGESVSRGMIKVDVDMWM